MKILMICPFALPNIGGVESHLQKLIKYLGDKGHLVYLLTYQPLTTRARGPSFEKSGNLEIHRVSWFGYDLFPRLEPYFPLTFLYLFPGLFVKSLVFYIGRHREVDVIHAHGLIAAAIAKILSKFYHKCTVVSTHAVYSFGERRLLASLVKFILRSFDVILAVGEPSRQELIGLGLPAAKIKVHPNWVDLNVFRPIGRESAKKELGLGKFVVLFVGRFLEKKGVRILLEASKKVLGGVEFVFIGGGELENEVENAVKTQKNIKYVGKLFQEKMEDLEKLIKYYSAADFLISPVLYEEGFATVLLEAIACGTPLMVSKRGSPPYFLDESVAVFLSPKPSVEEVVSKVGFYLRNADELKKIQSNCRPFAEERFSENNAGVILRSYEE